MKIKNKLNTLLVVCVFALGVVGCNYEQDYPPADKPVAAISPLNASAAEGDTVTLTVTMDRPFKYPAEFKLTTQDMESEALEGIDFLINDLAIYPEYNFGQQGFQIDIPSLVTTYSFDVVIAEDIEADEEENAVLRFNSAGNGYAIAQSGHQEVVIGINNTQSYQDFTSEDLGVKVAWSGTVTFPTLETDPDTGETTRAVSRNFELCTLDFDVLIELPSGSQTYLAGTAKCPEVGILPAGAPDGTYTLLVDYYDENLPANTVAIAPVAVPLRLTVANIGASDGMTTYPELFDIRTPISNGEGGAPVAVATIEKSGSNYTVTNIITGEVFYP